MISDFIYITVSVALVSILSLVGILFLLKRKNLPSIMPFMISFSAGTLLGVAFFDMLPELVSISDINSSSIYIIAGFLFFFVLEKYIHWHHCHEENCKIHPEGYLSLVGDSFHNFLDGAIISAAYLVNTNLGIVTTLGIIFHEIPQEIGDFFLLLHTGFSTLKALFWNFLVSLTSFLGAFLVFFSLNTEFLRPMLIAISAGGFIYIATVDIIPKIQEETSIKKSLSQSLLFLLGILTILALENLF